MQIVFWFSIFVIIYTFFGYGIVLYIMLCIKRMFKKRKNIEFPYNALPSLTLIVAAYNEEDLIDEKIKNTLALHYPSDKINYIFITDGSTDSTPDKIARHHQIKLMHTPARRGKINAMHRAVKEVNTEIIVFTDANTFLNESALINIARHYGDEKTGAVSGEKRVQTLGVDDATAGEGFYWKYESLLKKWDSELYSVVGAAGELFSVRTKLFEPVPSDTILDDFMISLLIAQKGYRIVYEPEAFAIEGPSANTKEELKRKVRIAAGGIQSIVRLKGLLNPITHPLLSFQYISHRVLRWTITPFFMIVALFANIYLAYTSHLLIYKILLTGQIFIYGAAFLGWYFNERGIKIKAFFIPYYFCMMNYAVLAGLHRYTFGKQSAAWEKAKRK